MHSSRDNLARLLQDVAKRDRASFNALYHATSAKLFGIVIRILRDRDLAEDLLQEIYVRIWDRAGDFDPAKASPITWMATIARNRAIDEVRRKRPQHVDNDISELEVPDGHPTPDADVELAEDLRRLNDCLEALEPERRDAIRLAYLDGHSRQDLATRFGVPVGTMKTWLHRGLKQLKECLGS